jgi:putative hemin transport protein
MLPDLVSRDRPGAALHRPFAPRCHPEETTIDALTHLDHAESTTERPFGLATLRTHGRVTPVDADLVPCVLEALAEQGLRIRLVAGHAGIVLSLEDAFFFHRRRGGWAELHGETTGFRLSVARLVSACVLDVQGRAGLQGSLRLYDPHGHLLASIRAIPDGDGADPPIWRALLRALMG